MLFYPGAYTVVIFRLVISSPEKLYGCKVSIDFRLKLFPLLCEVFAELCFLFLQAGRVFFLPLQLCRSRFQIIVFAGDFVLPEGRQLFNLGLKVSVCSFCVLYKLI